MIKLKENMPIDNNTTFPPPHIITKIPDSPPQQETNPLAMVAIGSILEETCCDNQQVVDLLHIVQMVTYNNIMSSRSMNELFMRTNFAI
ncbi:hypothetical protein MTR_5g064940 [Medicago truncatula]|uniref:Uncharacterized protein n=1 Tax=Medicago truncatula TaxID=3880 RepID=G7KAJ6_MEDTR|nr:hypothetical protein MTR_5g064940 [Medicago truncatula]